MLHPLAPGHLRHVNETFNACFQFDEGSVVGNIDDLALNPGSDRIAVSHHGPWVRRQLLEAQ